MSVRNRLWRPHGTSLQYSTVNTVWYTGEVARPISVYCTDYDPHAGQDPLWPRDAAAAFHFTKFLSRASFLSLYPGLPTHPHFKYLSLLLLQNLAWDFPWSSKRDSLRKFVISFRVVQVFLSSKILFLCSGDIARPS